MSAEVVLLMDRFKLLNEGKIHVIDEEGVEGFKGVMEGTRASVIIDRGDSLLVFWPARCPSLQFIFDTYGT